MDLCFRRMKKVWNVDKEQSHERESNIEVYNTHLKWLNDANFYFISVDVKTNTLLIGFSVRFAVKCQTNETKNQMLGPILMKLCTSPAFIKLLGCHTNGNKKALVSELIIIILLEIVVSSSYGFCFI